MSRFAPGVFIIEGEDDRKCELCGKVSECRPYGPNGEDICYECGIKDEDGVIKRIQAKMDAIAINPIEVAKIARNN